MLMSAQTNQLPDLFGDEDLTYRAHILRTTQYTELFAAATVAVSTVQLRLASFLHIYPSQKHEEDCSANND